MSVEETGNPADQATALLQQGRLPEARRLLERVCRDDRENAGAWLQLGAVNGLQNNHRAAADCFLKALQLRPDSVSARMNYAQALMQGGAYPAAAEQYERVTAAHPDSASAWFMLGRTRSAMDLHEEAAEAFRKALALQPDYPQAAHGLGYALHLLGRWEESIEHFAHALRLDPQFAQAHFGLGCSLQKTGNLDEALEHHREAARLKPGYAEAHLGIGTVLSLMGKQDLAVPALHEAIRLKPDYTEAVITLAATLMPLGRPDEALAMVEGVLAKEPGNIEAISLATTIDQHRGDIARAHERLRPLLEAGAGQVNVALAYATICSSLDEPGRAIGLMEQLLAGNRSLTATGRRNLHFQLGRLYDRDGQYGKAFEHYRLGNDLKQADFDPDRNTAETDAIIATHTPELMAALPRSSVRSGRPVFVVGMPRSGTSLVEQILASHPQVFGAGELPYIIHLARSLPSATAGEQGYPGCIPLLTQQEIDRAAQYYVEQIAALAPDAARIVDKMPGNFRYLGFIELLFPDARIIHCRRDPLDTCLSCYFQNFSRSHPYSYDLAHLGVFYRNYERLMRYWTDILRIPVLEVRYEDLVAEQEAGSRRIIDFCGLEWNERCLAFHQTERYVATASYDQVRRPMYESSVSRWKNYAGFIGPLRTALGYGQ